MLAAVGPLTGTMLALVAAFGGLDGLAHVLHYRWGWTFSALVWYLEHRWPVFHVLVGAALVVAFTHLEFHYP